MKILFVTPYPIGEAPSQRFRFEQYFEILEQSGHTYEVAPFMSRKLWDILYEEGRFFTKMRGITAGYLRRWLLAFRVRKYDVVFIHREYKPLGLPIAEWVACKLARKVVFDFDDAIWLKNFSQSNKSFSFIKRYSNVKNLCRWADVVSCGNSYLQAFASKFNAETRVNPTTIDTQSYHNRTTTHDNDPLVIGWTGSHSTTRYLGKIEGVLQKLSAEQAIEIHIISDLPPKLQVDALKFVKWKKATEIEDLLNFNIGIMPLEEDQWAKGKCGFKALQYMALGVPAIVSPVGVNRKIVDHGQNGYICDTEDEWYNALSELLNNREKLLAMGAAARRKIEDHYSVLSNQANFLHLFTDQNKQYEENSTHG